MTGLRFGITGLKLRGTGFVLGAAGLKFQITGFVFQTTGRERNGRVKTRLWDNQCSRTQCHPELDSGSGRVS